MNALLPIAGQASAWRNALTGGAVALVLGSLAYLLMRSWPLLFPPQLFIATAPPGCDLHAGPCAAAFDATRFIRLAIEPKAVVPNEPLRLLVDTAGFNAASVDVEFRGVDMNMGLIRNELMDTGGGSFTGDAVLPVCVRRRMSWQAIAVAQGDDAVHQATFYFEVNR